MTYLFDADFAEISVTVFLRMTGILSFDIYIKRGSNTYTKLFPSGESIDKARLAAYKSEKGINALFVHKDDYSQYLFYVEKVAENIFTSTQKTNTPIDDHVNVLNEMINLAMLEISVHMHVDQKSITQASTAVKGCIQMIARDPKSVARVLRYITRHSYTIKHAISTSLFALMLARLDKFESEKSLLIVGLGALLSDVGMSQLTFDPESKTELSPLEWKEIRQHPQLGKRILDSVKNITPEMRSIVLQHHEQPNRMGYPNGLGDKEIYRPSKMVAIADSFSALVSKRPYRLEAFPPLKALALMNEDRGKFDPELLRLFESIFIAIKN